MGDTERTDDLGGRIQAARKAAGLTQAELAAVLGVDRVQVSQWERGEWAPRRETLARLAEALGTTAAALDYGAEAASERETASTPTTGLPALTPAWRDSPQFWIGVQWALRGLMGRMAELQDAVLAHGAAATGGESSAAPAPPAAPPGVRYMQPSEFLIPVPRPGKPAAEQRAAGGGKRKRRP